jgi:hypothetical protein
MTANDWISKHHIRISADNIRRNPKRPRQPPRGERKQKDPEEFGKALIEQFEESVRYCNRSAKIIVDEDILFVLHTDGLFSFQEQILKRFGMNFSIQLDEYSAIVFFGRDFLEKFRYALKRYIEKSSLRSYIDRINSISAVKFNRVSPELSEWLDSSDQRVCIEIEILPNLGEERYASLIRKVIDFLGQQGEEVVGSRIRDGSASLRAYLKPETAKIIVQGVDSIWETRQAPPIITGKPQSVEIREKPTPKPPDPGTSTICILDTGIDTSQPFLRGVFLDAIDLTPDRLPQDSHGHGTFVAGLAAYGELENHANPKATARIISVKVLGSDSAPYPYLESRLEEAVRRFHDHAKIFNLSVMYPQHCGLSQPTDLAYTIDKLSNDYNVLFTVCTGNVTDKLPSLMASLPYPSYFGDMYCRMYGGAEASTSVTVGGLAKKESDRSIAKAGEPSPFTRRGDVNPERSKPDVVSWAGNIERMPETGEIRTNNEELGVMSLAVSPDTLGYDIGTSYAAPIVANVLARLSKEYPGAGPILLKALIVHFAYWPDQHLKLNASGDLKKALYGKGIPEFYQCTYSTKSCATCILEDSIEYNEIAWIPIYVPRIMRNIYGEKRMRVTLVYNPPVDRGVLGYTLVDLDFRLYKNYKIQQNWDRAYRRKWDNIKTDVFRWQRAGWGKEWSLMIFPTLRFRERIPNLSHGRQKFAVVVSLEDPSRRLNIYDAIMNERKMKTVPLEAFIQARRARAS